ncbi:MAG: RNA polymerase sigma factor, partial [bacterium]|nr:RNA polymerase sigma factor [bacterium]
ETLIRAYNGRKRWRKGQKVLSWLYGIEINVVREIWRRNSRYPASLDTNVVSVAVKRSESGTIDANMVKRLSLALADLPPRQREAVACRFLRRMTLRQTAETMGCAEGTVKAATSAGIKNLRKNMKFTQHG